VVMDCSSEPYLRTQKLLQPLPSRRFVRVPATWQSFARFASGTAWQTPETSVVFFRDIAPRSLLQFAGPPSDPLPGAGPAAAAAGAVLTRHYWRARQEGTVRGAGGGGGGGLKTALRSAVAAGEGMLFAKGGAGGAGGAGGSGLSSLSSSSVRGGVGFASAYPPQPSPLPAAFDVDAVEFVRDHMPEKELARYVFDGVIRPTSMLMSFSPKLDVVTEALSGLTPEDLQRTFDAHGPVLLSNARVTVQLLDSDVSSHQDESVVVDVLPANLQRHTAVLVGYRPSGGSVMFLLQTFSPHKQFYECSLRHLQTCEALASSVVSVPTSCAVM
jgi:hypothetical protein